MTRHLRLFPTFLSLTLILLLAQLSTLPASAQDESTPEAPAVSEELAESAEDEEKDIMKGIPDDERTRITVRFEPSLDLHLLLLML